jgi:fused signal recognition particle receptor
MAANFDGWGSSEYAGLRLIESGANLSGFCAAIRVLGLGKKPSKETTSWTSRLRAGLARTRDSLGGGLGALLGRGAMDEALFEELETALIAADCGVEASGVLIERLRARVRKDRITDAATLKQALKDALLEIVAPLEHDLDASQGAPCVIMIAGVNGSGKTTSIGKLAKWLQSQGKTVLLAAGDTFRAAAREQLETWGERNGVSVISQQNGDPGAVVFDAVSAARARGIDVVLADTAGRLPTQLHLMEEIRKVKRVLGKALPGAPHEILLVLDANTGQNALAQVRAFDEALGLTGLVLTKLDGTAKGGVVAAIALMRSQGAARRPIPLYFVGVGEGVDDLRPFVARDFVEALVD